MRVINAKLFRMFPGLKRLDLSQNEIELVETDAFRPPEDNRLAELYLERNKIKSLDEHVFDSLIHLKHLNLKENRLSFVADLTFQSLASLESLDLSRNKLTTLTELTFAGLASLQELYLSYNPLKYIDTDTFSFLGAHSPLSRLEIISNTDSDWFVFDDADICMLTNFKCGTQIHIDYEQNCNCFVKYSHLIGQEADITGSDSAWFKPCSLDALKFASRQENRYDKGDDEYEDQKLAKFECGKSQLQACFSKHLDRDLDSDDHLFNKSCLFNRLLKSTRLTTPLKQPVAMTTQAVVAETQESILKFNGDDSDSASGYAQMRGELSLDTKLKYILVGLGVLSIVSILSLMITFYLLVKSKGIQYHRAASEITKK